MPPENLLEGRNLSFKIGTKALITDVSLTIQPGEIVAVIGPNGAGKSTMLKLLSGELKPTHGEVILHDKSLRLWNKRDLAKIRAVLPQTSPLNFSFTTLEVTLIGRTPHTNGAERPRDYEIAREALAAVHAEHLASRLYTSLSGGEQQRVQLARVLAQIWEGRAARYLLLDEPTNNLDLSHQHGTLEIAAAFARRGVGVLAILHDLNLAAQYADRILVMKDSELIAEGTPNAVLTSTVIQRAFAMSALIEPHPCLNCPVVIAIPQNTIIKEI